MTDVFSTDGRRFYSVTRLWEVTDLLTTVDLPLAAIDFNLDTPHWDGGVSARNVMRAPLWHLRHTLRIYLADPRFPIVLQSGTLVVLDGMHRLARASLRGDRYVSVKVASPDLVDKCFLFEA